MTFWWTENNYGQILQCYALQKYLINEGHDVFLIKYDPRMDINKKPIWVKAIKGLNIFKVIKYLYSKIKNLKYIEEQNKNNRFFSDFRKNNLVSSERIYYSYDELIKDPPLANIYITGSDQVWNLNCLAGNLKSSINQINAYYLNFGAPNIIRLSYAASFGVKNISSKYSKIIQPLLKKFSFISVREEEGVDICKKMGLETFMVPDPTLLLSELTYKELINKSKSINEKYILVYIVDNVIDIKFKKIIKFAESMNMRILYITANGLGFKYEKIFPSVEEWLNLINNSQYVITNSFHCCVFSYLFHKQFGAIQVSGKSKGMNSRLDNLWKILNIQPRIIMNSNFSVLFQSYDSKVITPLSFNLQLFNSYINKK